MAAARGDDALAAAPARESAAGWRRITDRGRGDRMHAVFADFGRPAIGLVEPAARARARVAEPESRRRSSMPPFSDAITTPAPPEEVWKLLYDASRFAEWWAGHRDLRGPRHGGAPHIYPDGYPDFPMPQRLRDHRATARPGRDLLPGLRPPLRVAPGRATPAGTRIEVEVDVPEEEAQRFERQREVAQKSLKNLAERARA